MFLGVLSSPPTQTRLKMETAKRTFLCSSSCQIADVAGDNRRTKSGILTAHKINIPHFTSSQLIVLIKSSCLHNKNSAPWIKTAKISFTNNLTDPNVSIALKSLLLYNLHYVNIWIHVLPWRVWKMLLSRNCWQWAHLLITWQPSKSDSRHRHEHGTYLTIWFAAF